MSYRENPFKNIVNDYYETHNIRCEHGWFADSFQTEFPLLGFVDFLDFSYSTDRVKITNPEQINIVTKNNVQFVFSPIDLRLLGSSDSSSPFNDSNSTLASEGDPQAYFDSPVKGNWNPPIAGTNWQENTEAVIYERTYLKFQEDPDTGGEILPSGAPSRSLKWEAQFGDEDFSGFDYAMLASWLESRMAPSSDNDGEGFFSLAGFEEGGWFTGFTKSENEDENEDEDEEGEEGDTSECKYEESGTPPPGQTNLYATFSLPYKARLVGDVTTGNYFGSSLAKGKTYDPKVIAKEEAKHLRFPYITNIVHINDIVEGMKLLNGYGEGMEWGGSFWNKFVSGHRRFYFAMHQLIQDIQNGKNEKGEKGFLTVKTNQSFKLPISTGCNIGQNDEGDPIETWDDSICNFYEEVVYDLFLTDIGNRPKTDGGIVAFASDYILGEKVNIAGQVYDKTENGRYSLRTNISAKKRAAQLDLEYNEFLGKWSAGTTVKLAYVHSDTIPSMLNPNNVPIDGLEQDEIEDLLREGKTPKPGRGFVIPLTMGQNPTQWIPLMWDSDPCDDNDNPAKVVFPVLNFTDAKFLRGEICKISKIDGVWHVEKYYPGEEEVDNKISNWEFFSFIQNAKTFFRLPTTKLKTRQDFNKKIKFNTEEGYAFPNNENFAYLTDDGSEEYGNYFEIITPETFESAYNQQYYQNPDIVFLPNDDQGPVDTKQEKQLKSRMELASPVHHQVCSWDFLAANWGGFRGSNALVTTQFSTGADGQTIVYEDRFDALVSYPFFGPVFPAGYRIGQYQRIELTGPSVSGLLGEGVFTGDREWIPEAKNPSFYGIKGIKSNPKFIRSIPPGSVDSEGNPVSPLYPLDPDPNLYDNFFSQGSTMVDFGSATELSQIPADIALNMPASLDGENRFVDQIGGPGTSLAHLSNSIYPSFRDFDGKDTDSETWLESTLRDPYEFRVRVSDFLYSDDPFFYFYQQLLDPKGQPSDYYGVRKPVWGLQPLASNQLEFRPLKNEVLATFDHNIAFSNTQLLKDLSVNLKGFWLGISDTDPFFDNFPNVSNRDLYRGIFSWVGQRPFARNETNQGPTNPLSHMSAARGYAEFWNFRNANPFFDADLDPRRQYFIVSPIQGKLDTGDTGEVVFGVGRQPPDKGDEPGDGYPDGKQIRTWLPVGNDKFGQTFFNPFDYDWCTDTTERQEKCDPIEGSEQRDGYVVEPRAPQVRTESIEVENYEDMGENLGGGTQKGMLLRFAYNDDFQVAALPADEYGDPNTSENAWFSPIPAGFYEEIDVSNAAWASNTNFDGRYWNKVAPGSDRIPAGAVGVIGARCTTEAKSAINLNTVNDIGVRSRTIFPEGYNLPGWGNSNNAVRGFQNFNTTELWAAVYHHWPREQTIYDPRWFVVHHFNPGHYKDNSVDGLAPFPLIDFLYIDDLHKISSKEAIEAGIYYEGSPRDREGESEDGGGPGNFGYELIRLDPDGVLATSEAVDIADGPATPPESRRGRALPVSSTSNEVLDIDIRIPVYEDPDQPDYPLGRNPIHLDDPWSDPPSRRELPYRIDENVKIIEDSRFWFISTARRGLLLPTRDDNRKGVPIPQIGIAACTGEGACDAFGFDQNLLPLDYCARGKGYRPGDRFRIRPPNAKDFSDDAYFLVSNVDAEGAILTFTNDIREVGDGENVQAWGGAGFLPQDLTPTNNPEIDGLKINKLKTEEVEVNGSGACFYAQDLIVYNYRFIDQKPAPAFTGKERVKISQNPRTTERSSDPVEPIKGESLTNRFLIDNPSSDNKYDIFFHFHNDVSHTWADPNQSSPQQGLVTSEQRILVDIGLE